MLIKHITLYTIEQIFKNECKARLSATEKMLYINCLTHNFIDKDATLSNLNEFCLLKETIPNHNYYADYFIRIVSSGLIVDVSHSYKFLSLWIKYMDLSNINEVGNSKMKKMDEDKIQAEFLKSQQLIELCCMKHGLNKSQVEYLMKQFIQEQIVTDKTYYNVGDAKKHFIYWCGSNKQKAPQDNIVKSKGKILGL
jgi:hypothetical protein